jgi:hypothetical protein
MTSRLKNTRGMHLFLSLFTINTITWQSAFDFTKSFEVLQFQVFWNFQRECEVGEGCDSDSHCFRAESELT